MKKEMLLKTNNLQDIWYNAVKNPIFYHYTWNTAFKNYELLWCAPETILYINYTFIQNEFKKKIFLRSSDNVVTTLVNTLKQQIIYLFLEKS